MRKLTVNLGERSYQIHICSGLINEEGLVAPYCVGENVLILSNKTIAPLYISQLSNALSTKKIHHFLIDDGEQYKNLEHFSRVLDYLAENGFRRNDTLIALGGGVIGDLGGFVASSYQRGMGLIQFPTSLLAQVDSSVGGKTAVNHPLGKNMIGAFYQPNAVFIDTDTLDTLPDKEYFSGFAEVIKYAMLGTLEIEDLLLNKLAEIKARNKRILAEIIYFSCRKKSEVVADDEKERGSRALLNLGHTFGHAIEKITRYKTYLHGEAVSIGILMAVNLSIAKGLLTKEFAVNYRRIISALGLPGVACEGIDVSAMLDAMKLDKKNVNEMYRLVLPAGDNCILVEESDLELLERAIEQQLK